MKKVISFSLWGDDPKYWIGALKNIELCKKLYIGWICRFYIDKTCKKELVNSLIGKDVEIILVESKDNYHGMFWRFYAASDPEVYAMISRDCDSRLSERELLAVNEWLNSDKDFHIMRDHPYHTVPILGGMWGCKNKILINIKDYINQWNKFSNHGIDQDFLGQIIYPKVKNNAIEHVDFNINYGGDIKPFPSERYNYEYVGEAYDENDIRDKYYEIIKKLC